VSNSEIYRQAINEQIENEQIKKEQNPNKPKLKNSWEEIISETPELKIVKLHDIFEGKKCRFCDKELQPNKIIWETLNDEIGFEDQKTKTISKTVIISPYSLCSEKCKEAMIRSHMRDSIDIEKNIKSLILI
jgi:hypothetical protein